MSRLKRGLERRLRPAIQVWARLTRGTTLGVRALVTDAEGRVLLLEHSYVPGWHLPGGGVEAGETALQALERELQEEAAIRLHGPPQLHGVFFNRRASRRDHVLVYVVRAFSRGSKKPDREIAESGFFPLERLPEGTTRGTRERLAEVAAGAPPGGLW